MNSFHFYSQIYIIERIAFGVFWIRIEERKIKSKDKIASIDNFYPIGISGSSYKKGFGNAQVRALTLYPRNLTILEKMSKIFLLLLEFIHHSLFPF